MKTNTHFVKKQSHLLGFFFLKLVLNHKNYLTDDFSTYISGKNVYRSSQHLKRHVQITANMNIKN